MKVLEIINGLDSRGGAEVFFSNLCSELKKDKDVDLCVVSLYDKTETSLKETFESNNIKVNFCHKETGRKKAAKLLKKYINDFKPDIINSHLSALTTYIKAFGFKKRNWRIVQTIHSLPSFECGKIEKILRLILLKKKNLSFIGISDSITNIASTFYKTKNIETIYNGIKLKNTIYNSKDKQYDLVCVANYTDVKNHQMLFNTIEKLYTQNNQPLKLVCVGHGEKLTEYKKIITSFNSSKYIKLLGPSKDVYQYLSISKIFILTSKYEGNPISILEAMDAGLPIIAPKIGGIPDIVKEGINGYLFEPLNMDSLIEKLQFLINDNEQIKNISINNINAIKKYDIEIVAKNYINYFKKVIIK